MKMKYECVCGKFVSIFKIKLISVPQNWSVISLRDGVSPHSVFCPAHCEDNDTHCNVLTVE